MTEITVAQLKQKRDAGEQFILLDVREPDEVAIASIAAATTIPMAEIPQHVSSLPTDRPIVVMCHHGGRSAAVTNFLNTNGYENAVNLAGGIDAWASQIDHTVSRY
jgi:rhodanese-related sulfurtransferase